MVEVKDWVACICCGRQKLAIISTRIAIEFAFDRNLAHDAIRYIDSLPRKSVGVLMEKIHNRRPQETKAQLLVLMQDYADGKRLRGHELGSLGTREDQEILEFKCKNLRLAFYRTTCQRALNKTVVRITNGFTKTGQKAPPKEVNKAHAIAKFDKEMT